ncbi:MAG: phosphatidylserine decarboxylase [Sulfurimonas sp.]
MKSNLFPISQVGLKYMVYSFALFTLFVILDFDFFALIFFVLIFLFAYIYRNPERELLIFEKNSFLAPVDGEVIAITELKDKDYGYKIEVNNSYLDVAVLRAPFDSKLEDVFIQKGARLSLDSSLAQTLNENVTLVFSNANASKVKIKHILKQSITTFDITVKKSQFVHQTARYGTMPNGVSEIYIPRNFRLNINVGTKLLACETLIGYFISVP